MVVHPVLARGGHGRRRGFAGTYARAMRQLLVVAFAARAHYLIIIKVSTYSLSGGALIRHSYV
jgi:hypothetical protein